MKIKIEIEIDTADPDDMADLDELTALKLRSEFRHVAQDIAEQLVSLSNSNDRDSGQSVSVEEDNDEQ